VFSKFGAVLLARNAEISDLYRAFIRKKNILWLQVSMHNSSIVDRLHSGGHLA
jgi:hypothetical protein